MASKNSTKTQLELIVDLDLTPGQIEAKKLTKGIQKQIDKLTSGLAGETKLPLDFSIDTAQIEKDLAKARKLIQVNVDKALKGLGTSSAQGSKSDITALIKQKLKASTDVIDKDGKIVKDKLIALLAEIGKATGNTGSLGPRGKNPLKEYLDLTGKSINQAVQVLNARAPELKKAIENVIAKGNEALSKAGVVDAEKSLTKLTNSIVRRQQVTAQEIKQSQDTLSAFNAKTVSAANKFAIATSPTSTLADSTRTKSLNEYTSALLNEINALDLAKKSGKELAFSEAELAQRTDELWEQLKKVSPELFKLTQNLKDSVKGTPQAVQQFTKATGELADLRIKLSKAQSATGTRDKNNKDTVTALGKEKAATIALVDAYTQIDKLTKSRNFAGEIANLQARVELINQLTSSINSNIAAQKASDAAEARKKKQEQLTKPSPDKTKVELDSAQQASASSLLAVQDAKRLREALADTGVSKREKLKLLQQELNAEEKYLAALQRRLSAEKQSGLSPSQINATTQALSEQRKVVNSLASEVSRLDTLYVQTARAIQLFFRYAVLYGLMYKAVDSVRALLSSIIDLQAALVSIKAVAGATANEMLGITAAVQNVAQTTAFSVTEVAQAGQTLVQAGVAVSDFGSVLSATANLASSTGSTLQESADILTTFMEVFENTRPEDIADKLRNAVNISKLSVGDLRTIGNFLLETSDSFNLSIDNVTSAAATLRNAGIKASTIGTGLRQGLLELFKPDKKTLEGLQKQYASIGQNLSKEVIAEMFAGFAKAKDPLLAVLNELQKLGVGGVGDNQFTRVLDIRAENTIKTLVRNKDAYVANQEAIKQTGTAAEGAKVQLEALSNSFNNLVETITNTVYTSLEGTITLLVKATKSVTSTIDTFKSSLDTLRADTGSTGVFGSAATGIGAFAAAMLRQVSIGGSLVTGLAAGVLGEVFTVLGATSKTLAGFAKAVEVITVGLLANSAVSIVSKLGSKAKAAAGGLAAGAAVTGTEGVVGAVAAEGAATVAAGILAVLVAKLKSVASVAFNFGKFLISRTGLIGLALTGLFEVANYFFDFFGDAATLEQEKAKGLQAQAQTLAKSRADLEAEQKAAQAEQKNIAEFGQTVAKARQILSTYSGQGKGDEIVKIMEQAADGVVAVGSQALDNVAAQIDKASGAVSGRRNKERLATELQQINTAIQQAEGVRQAYFREVEKAYSDISEGTGTEQSKRITDAYQSLTSAEQTLVSTRVDDLTKAESILRLKTGKVSLTKTVQDKITSLSGDELNKSVEQAFNAYQAFLKDPQQKAGANYAQLQAQLLSAIANGQDKVVEAILAVTDNLFSDESLAAARKNKAAQVVKPFQDALRNVQQETPIEKAALPTIDAFEKEFNGRKAQLEKQNAISEVNRKAVEAELTRKQASLEKFSSDAIAEITAGSVSEERLAKLNQELTANQTVVNQLKDKLATLAHEEVTTEESLASAQRASLAGELEVKAKKEQLATLHNTKVHKVEDEVKLLDEIYKIQREQLDTEKDTLGLALKKQVEDERLFSTEGVPLKEVLAKLGTSAGSQALAASEKLAAAYKAVAEVTDKEANLRNQYLADLEDAQRKELEAKLGEAKKKFTEQQSRTTSLQNNLQNAQTRLATAQDKLAALYEKQAELEAFFNQSLREISGKKLEVSDVKSTIQSAAESGSIELAKSAVADIKELLSTGKVSKGEAISLTEQAREVAIGLNEQDIQDQTRQVQFLTDEVSHLSSELNLSRYAEQDLKTSVDTLTQSLDNLKKTVEDNALLAGNQPQAGKDVVQVETSGTQVNSVQGLAEGGLVTGPGGPKEDRVPLMGSHGEFMQPTKAVNLYGKDFMESIRSLKINPEVARAVAKPTNSIVPKANRVITNSLQPVTFKLGEASITAMAEADQVPGFQTALRVQRLKSGRRSQ